MGATVSSSFSKAKNLVVDSILTREQGDLDTGIGSALNENTHSAELWVTQGHAAELKGAFQAALDNYSIALQQDPDNLPAMQSTARLYARQKRYTDAAEWYQRLVTISPSSENYAELADSQLKSGNIDEALGSIQNAIAIDPVVPQYLNQLASVLVAQGRSGEAVSQLERIFPAAIANYNVAYLHYTNGNAAAAQLHLNAALQADPHFKKARELKATLTNIQSVQAVKSTHGVADGTYRSIQPSLSQAAAPTPWLQLPRTKSATDSFQSPTLPAQHAILPSSQTVPAFPTVPQDLRFRQ